MAAVLTGQGGGLKKPGGGLAGFPQDLLVLKPGSSPELRFGIWGRL